VSENERFYPQTQVQVMSDAGYKRHSALERRSVGGVLLMLRIATISYLKER